VYFFPQPVHRTKNTVIQQRQKRNRDVSPLGKMRADEKIAHPLDAPHSLHIERVMLFTNILEVAIKPFAKRPRNGASHANQQPQPWW
jgi:hypothetical protein